MTCFYLFVVSLLRNPVVHKSAYRYYMIHLLPNLRVLDFKRVRLRVSGCGRKWRWGFLVMMSSLLQEKQKAKEMFGVKKAPDKPKTCVGL